MRLSVPKLLFETELEENRITVLSVERPDIFTDLCSQLWNLHQGKSSDVYATEKDSTVDLAKRADVIWNPIALSVNERKILEQYYTELGSIIQDKYFEEMQSLNGQIVSFLDNAVGELPYFADYNLELNVKGLFKLYEVKMNEDDGILMERLLHYIRLLHQVCHKELFFAVNLKQYLTVDELEELYKGLFYEKVHMIILEGYHSASLKGEKGFIIDQDCCIIETRNDLL